MHIVSNTQGTGGQAGPLLAIGNFRIVEQLGSRPHANVYAGEHTGLERRVTIRVLKRELVGDEQATARFLAEAKVGSRLRSPHVPEIFDIGQLPDGRPYYAMEALHGSSLQALLDGAGSIPLPRALRLIDGIGAALEHAHAAGIIHRDLRPANVVVESRGGELEHAMVLGFGEPPADDGEIAFRSPEQGCGVDAQIDPKTDLYALGAILYRMLGARPPFPGKTSGELLLAQMTSAPTPLRELDVEIPIRVEAAVARALSRDPAQRQKTVRELLDGLRDAKPIAEPTPAISPATAIEEPWFDAAEEAESPPTARRFVRTPAGMVLIATSLVAIGLAVVLFLGRTPAPVATVPASPPVATPTPVATTPTPVAATPTPVAAVPAPEERRAAEPRDEITQRSSNGTAPPASSTRRGRDPQPAASGATDGWHAVDFTRRAAATARKTSSNEAAARRKPASDDAKRMLAYPE